MRIHLKLQIHFLFVIEQLFGANQNALAPKTKMKDYGNISSSTNNQMDLVDDSSHFQFDYKMNLPLDIGGDDGTMTQQSNNKDIDLWILRKALIPKHMLKEEEMNKIWTVQSILNDLETECKNKK